MAENKVQTIKQVIESDPKNSHCADCGMVRPQWASTTYGIFLCLNCAGVHRSFGVKVSVVKSVTMDMWPERDIKQMELGGNSLFLSYIEKKGLGGAKKPQLYAGPAAKEYAQALEQTVSKVCPNLAKKEGEKKEHGKSREFVSSSTKKMESPSSQKQTSLSSNYTSTYPGGAVSSTASGPAEMLGWAASQIFSGAVSISGHLADKVILPASGIIKEKSSQLAEYVMKKKEKPAKPQKREEQDKPRARPKERRSASDKWD